MELAGQDYKWYRSINRIINSIEEYREKIGFVRKGCELKI